MVHKWMLLMALVFILSYAAADTNPQDVVALKTLYASLKSPPLLGWNSSKTDPCGDLWQGVQCSGNSIVAIRLPNLKLRGSLGTSLTKFNNLLILDLSNNHLGQMIPFQLPPRLQELYLGNNVLIGDIPYSIKRLSSLTNLNVSWNFLSGELPDTFQELIHLQSLDVSNNNFTGQLPGSFSSLSSLSTLHLQQNQLNGTIDVLTHLPLKDLNIENNGFSGAVPPAVASIPIFRGSGNQLHMPSGSPIPSFQSNGEAPTQTQASGAKSWADGFDQSPTKNTTIQGPVLAGIIAGVIILAIFSALVCFMLYWKKHHKMMKLRQDEAAEDTNHLKQSPWVDVHQKEKCEDIIPFHSPDRILKPVPSQKNRPEKMSGPLRIKSSNVSITVSPFSLSDIQAATHFFNQENLIGEGTVGRVYKARFSGGKVLAIKKIKHSSFLMIMEDDILTIISNISRLHHANIAELVGFCCDNGEYYLLYEYFPKGTLHDMLHSVKDNGQSLSWNARMKIALGSAKALEYLHEVASPVMIHRNFKSTNIFLDDDFNPRLSDCGIATLVPFSSEREISAPMLGSFGYSAPEYALSGIYTTKSDVYSFGAVMLELLTGRKPLDSSRPRMMDQSLVRWARSQLHDFDSLTKIVDPTLKNMYPAKALSRFAEVISLCVQAEPELRPCMSEVVQSLVRIMQRTGISKRTRSYDMRSYDENDPSSGLSAVVL